jgi:hypothetical protein
MREKHFFLFSLIIGSLMILAFFWMEGERKEVLNPGHPLPVMKYLTRDGVQILAVDSSRFLMIMYFNRKCEHCLYQLDLLEKNIDLFPNQKFIFLTSEVKFLSEGNEKQWSTLSTRQNCTFGIVPGNDFLNAFGTIGTPAIFIFNSQGILLFRFNGEIKLAKLKQVLGISE